ncbi:EAL domain-containing protein [Thiospirillum jenense]|uniref:cyclic-guanylate-specific phosphodiesterase n=1 Tax=Thiospirillum jenense TaxID=1653858 RepID=A0A839HHD7_9GAMM|nr:EAL domain-containing protein [Thiospirillum jenense]MBB1126417.1 EAL domain-containing protein [Thiospirillum jenense]
MLKSDDTLFSMPILVVDDEPTNTRLLDKILTKAGYQFVIVTNDPRQTLTLFDAHRPGVILLDLNMPYLDGFAVLEQLRTHTPNTMPPVVVLTAQSDQTSRLRALQGGARDFVTKPFDRAELLVRIQNMLAIQLAEQQRLRFYAHFDSVTGLPNRTYTMQLLQQTFGNALDDTQSTTILLLALQQFKRINQSFGYEAGDDLLRLLKDRLQQLLIGQRTVLGRVEGARFLIVLPGLGKDSAVLADFIENLIARLHSPIELNGVEIRPALHIGAAVYPEDATNTADLLARAEAALAQAQQQTDLPYAFCDPGTDARVREQLEFEAELHRALEREEFFLVYQPQFDLATGRIRGVEALLRWRHPIRGIVSPAQFIPVLEQTGLILQVGEWLLQAALMQARQWQQAGFPPLCMAVNLSPRQFQGNNLLTQIETALSTSGVKTDQIELEVTESLLVEDFPGTLQLLQTLEQMGIKIALDDFGTGYSALTYLHAFPFHVIKIDRSFVSTIGHSPKSEALLQGIVQLGKSLQLEIIAEGIETEAQRQHLLGLNCDTGQGFGLCRPKLPHELEALLKTGYL